MSLDSLACVSSDFRRDVSCFEFNKDLYSGLNDLIRDLCEFCVPVSLDINFDCSSFGSVCLEVILAGYENNPVFFKICEEGSLRIAVVSCADLSSEFEGWQFVSECMVLDVDREGFDLSDCVSRVSRLIDMIKLCWLREISQVKLSCKQRIVQTLYVVEETV